MRAVIMAGGLGSRLRPLTTALPKPLLPVVGRPMLEHALLLAGRHGVTDAVLTVQYMASLIRAHMGDGSDCGVALSYETEHRPLGTAGGVRAAADGFDDDFLVLSGDAVTDIDLTELVDRHRASGAWLTLCLTRRTDPREFGIVDTDDGDRVVRFHEKPAWGEVFSDTVSTGIYVVSPAVLELIPPDEPQDWSTEVIPRLLELGVHVGAHVSAGFWEDVGDVEAYRRVQVEALDGRVALSIPGIEREPGVWIGEGVRLPPGEGIKGPAYIGAHCLIEDGASILPYAVIGANAVVRGGSTIERAILLDNGYVGLDVTLRGCVIGRSVDIGNGSRVGEGAVVADDCTLEQEVDVTPGSLVYPSKTIESGSIIHGAVVWDSKGHRHLLAAGGITGVASVDITPDNLGRIASALASTLPKDGVVAIGRDQSRTARVYSGILGGVLMAAGLTVRDHRIVPTPVIRSDVALNADAGVMFTLVAGDEDMLEVLITDADGRDIDERTARRIERIFDRREFRRPYPGVIGDLSNAEGALSAYADRVRGAVSLDGVSGAGLSVVIDARGGSAALVLPTVLAGIDVDVVLRGGRLEDGRPARTPAEAARDLQALARTVVQTGSSLGISIGPTGERLTLVDELGQVLDDDRALLVVMDLVAAESQGGHVVLPVTTSRVAEQVASFHGIDVRRVAFTETFVEDQHALISSDGQGGFAVRGCGGHRDAVATTIALLGLVARTNLALSAIDARIPRTVSVRHAVATPWAAKGTVMRALQEQAGGRGLDLTDGVRVVEDDGSWCLAIPDSHEPMTRLWVEAPTYARAMQVGEEWIRAIERVARGESGTRG